MIDMLSFAYLLPVITAAAVTGLSCGSACGGCGNPMTNAFLAAYLFTHSGRLKRSVVSFAGFYMGKIIAVVLLCVIAAWLGSRIVDDAGKLFGLNMQFFVQFLMFLFAMMLIGRWLYRTRGESAQVQKQGHCAEHKDGLQKYGHKDEHKIAPKKNLPMIVCGFISGVAPCAPLIMAIGYASALSVAEAALIGVVFSVASSALPIVVLVLLTGLLSGAMFKEIPNKIRYLQLGSYVLVAAVSGYTLLQSI